MSLNKLYFLINLFIYILIYWKRSWESFSIYSSLMTILLIVIKCSKRKLSFPSKSTVYAICISVIVSVFAFLGAPTFGFGSYIILFSFFFQILFLSIVNLSPVEQKNICFFAICSLWLYLFLPIMKDVNSNSIGQCIFSYGIAGSLLFPKNMKGYCLLSFHSILIISGILLSESRMALAAYSFYIILRITPIKILERKSVLLLLILMLTIGSLVYVFVYTYVWWNDVDISLFEDISAEKTNKHVYSGRQLIWLEVYNLILEYPLLGFGSKFQLQSFSSMNIHNSILAMIGIYGGIIGGLCIYLLIKVTYSLRSFLDDNIVRNCFCGFCASLLMGFNETYLLNYSFIAMFPLTMAYARINHMKTSLSIKNVLWYESKFYCSRL